MRPRPAPAQGGWPAGTAAALPPAHVLVLQHIACEGPGAYGEVMAARGAAVRIVTLDEGEPLPDWRAFDAIVAMGGPMSANDEAKWPWLHSEKRCIGEAVRAGVPFFGACLGAQLLAASLGARVHRGARPEVGVLPVYLTAAALDDLLFADLPPAPTTRELVTLQWHNDTFELPAGAVLLARSRLYPHQAFRWRNAYGLQFHLEVSAALARQWVDVPAYADSLDQVLGPGGLAQLIDELEVRAPEMLASARRIFERWLDSVVLGVGRLDRHEKSAAETRGEAKSPQARKAVKS